MAEQYSWLDASGKGYSAGQYSGEAGKLMKWTRSTVADGKWLNKETIEPFSGRDQYLLDSLNQTYDECSAFSGYLNEEIRIINARADVIDVVGSHDAFTARSAELVSGVDISDRDVIKILNDVGTDIPVWIYNTENNKYVESTVSPSNQQTYYRWLSAVNDGPSGWEYVGDLEPYYKDIDLTENSITFENTAPERDYTINTDKYIQMLVNDRTGTIGLTDEFISSASQCYTALTSHSASWDETSATLNANSGYWDQAYTALTSHSASWDETSATLNSYSANWQATYSAVSANSAIWNETAYVPLSALECKIGSANDVSDVAFAQGSANSAEHYSLAQGISNSAKSYAAAFGTGNNASETAITQGNANTASYQSIAIGNTNSAYLDSFAQGTNNVATNKSLAQGYNITATDYAFGQGSANTVEEYSFAQGANNTAQYTAFAQGSNITATTTGFAQGDNCKANNIALAQGQYASANDYSMAQGQKVYANYVSFAEGEVASAKSVSFAQGNDAIADSYSFVQGHMASATNMSMAQGHNGVIAHKDSFAQGESVQAYTQAIAQGHDASAEDKSIAQGYNATATTGSFAQGSQVKADYYSLSQGLNISANNYSIAQGYNNSAFDYSQAFGKGTKLIHSGMAIGTYNSADNVPFVIGNGTGDDHRSDLFLIDRSGNVSATGNVSAKNFYINGNPIDSVVSAKFSAYNGSNTPLTSYPISSFGLYANTAKYITVATANNNRLDFSVADALINSASSGYQAKQWINTNGDGIIGSAKSGAAASAWIASNGATFMPKSQTFAAKGNPNSFNTTFSYTGFTLSAGEGIGFYNAGTNSLGISAQAGIPDGTIVYQGITGYNVVGEKNLSKLCITDYVTATRSYQQLEYSAGATTNKFNLWPTTASTAANLVDGTIIPVIDPIGNRYKNEYTTLSQLGEALNIGNYVSAGNNQKLTIMSAENLTLANMQPGVIYLV